MLTKEQILQYLEEINAELANQEEIGEIVICGGAVMTLVFDARESTKDIDALFAPTNTIRNIAKELASKHSLEEDWLNDAAKGFIDTGRMHFKDVVKFSNLTVRRPCNEEMLALKLSSAREDSKDAEDALFLMNVVGIQNLNEAYEILERYIPPARLTPMANFFTQEMYARYKELSE